MRHLIYLTSMILIVAIFAAPSAGQIGEPKTGYFWATLEGDAAHWNELNISESGGDGYHNSGPWYSYPSNTPQSDPWGNSNPVPSWHNQWWYDDPFDPLRWKEVTINFVGALNDPTMPGGGHIVINWSTENWTSEVAPPMTNEDPVTLLPLIGRTEVTEFWLDQPGTYQYSNTFDLRDFGVNYNPVWISVDIAGYNMKLSDNTNPGSIIHTCVPEPSTLLLLLMGGILYPAMRYSRRH
jgi:hypothetical protein